MNTFAQVKTPPLSQKQTVTQKVGFTTVTIEYCRPLMRGREIFGGLEKYGEVWRTGANKNTKISFDGTVTIGGKELEKGDYTLLTRPDNKEWTVYFYPFTNEYGVPDDFEEGKSLATLKIPVFELNRTMQNLTINLDNVTQNTAELTLAWEKTLIVIPMDFTTEKVILDKVANMKNDHSSDYYMAAMYYMDTQNDLEKAKMFIQKSIDLREEEGGTPKFWIFQKQAEVYEAAGEKKAALKSAMTAAEMAASRGKNDYYVKQIEVLLGRLK